MTEEKNLAGLRGWLALVGLGIILSPLRIVALVFPTYLKLFSNDSWEKLTTPGKQAYHPLWSSILVGEIAINCAFVFVWLYIALLFFLKKKVFPKWYIGIMMFALVFIVLDALAIKMVLPNEPLFDADSTKELVRTLIAVLIWVPYMLVSKRVKATFLN